MAKDDEWEWVQVRRPKDPKKDNGTTGLVLFFIGAMVLVILYDIIKWIIENLGLILLVLFLCASGVALIYSLRKKNKYLALIFVCLTGVASYFLAKVSDSQSRDSNTVQKRAEQKTTPTKQAKQYLKPESYGDYDTVSYVYNTSEKAYTLINGHFKLDKDNFSVTSKCDTITAQYDVKQSLETGDKETVKETVEIIIKNISIKKPKIQCDTVKDENTIKLEEKISAFFKKNNRLVLSYAYLTNGPALVITGDELSIIAKKHFKNEKILQTKFGIIKSSTGI